MFPLSDSIRSPRFPFFNLAVIAATIFIFIQQIISPTPDAFLYQYSLIPSQINPSDSATWLPFVTAIFLHGGFLHILSNMWFLWVFGDNVETHIGAIPFLFFYFLSGIVGNLTQYILMPDSSIPMLGASGAVAGILGAYYVLFPHSKIKTFVPFFGFITIVNISAPFMLVYWFVLQLISGTVSLPGASDVGGVAFWAHVGGFATGLILAKLFSKENSYSHS